MNTEATFQRAAALHRAGDPAGAERLYRQVLSGAPDHLGARNNLAVALIALDRPAEAVEALREALRLAPREPRAHNTLGEALMRVGRYAEALASFDAALALAGDYANARWNRSLALLSLGRFAEGWRDYEHRWRASSSPNAQISEGLRARLESPFERQDLIGREVVLVSEQGVGDVIMFASMIPDLQREASGITLLCEPRFRRLFSQSFPNIPTQSRGALPAGERVVALGSLGRLYRNAREDFPGSPYLSASPQVRRRWRDALGETSGRLRVGLSWRGGSARSRSGARSISLDDLRPLFDIAGADFVSLQYGDVAAEIDAFNAAGGRLRRFEADEIDDFEDLAGLIQSLDVVVTVQTAVAHLAGAVGAPTLVMLPHGPEWRYASEEKTMPWYGSVRLLRQEIAGDWGGVVARVAEALQAFPQASSSMSQ